jgi:protocatechuate 3,4-dioxygenase beta subunit
VIAGRVLDDAGEPMSGVTVQALRPAYVEGRRQLVIAAMTSGFQGTDDTGAYQIGGLTPGTYYLRAMTRETWTSTASGRRELIGFHPTYFPSTPEFSGARAVEVGVGQRVTDADIPLVIGRPAAISGVALDSRGRPLAGRAVGLGQRFLREAAGGGGSSAGSTPVLADGRFEFKNVTPGEYQLSIFNGELGTPNGEYGVVHITVDGVPLENVVLETSAGWSISGRFVTEDGLLPDLPRDRVTVRGFTLNQMAVAGATRRR